MRTWLFILIGGVLGLAVATGVYLSLNPVLEQSTGLVREMQGMLWNLVPLLTVLGMVLGWWFARRRSA
jgi:H+/Cl- antiporter ClcA